MRARAIIRSRRIALGLTLNCAVLLSLCFAGDSSADSTQPVAFAAADTRSKPLDEQIKELLEQGKVDQAAPLADQFIKAAERSANPRQIASALSTKGQICLDRNLLLEGRKFFSQALDVLDKMGRSDPEVVQDIARNLINLALVDQLEGDADAAERRLNEALVLQEKVLPNEHIDIAAALIGLAKVSQLRGDLKTEEQLWTRALAMRERLYTPQHYNVAVTLEGRAGALESQGRYKEAEPLLRKALEYRLATQDKDHPHLASVHQRLANNLRRQGKDKYAEAESLLLRALEIRNRSKSQPGDRARNMVDLGLLYLSSNRFSEAKNQFQGAVSILRQRLPETHSWIAEAQMHLAFTESLLGHAQEALDVSRAVSKIYTERPPKNAALPNIQYRDHVRYLWDFRSQLKPSRWPELDREGFEISQRASVTRAAQSAARMATRLAAGDPALQTQVREQQDLTNALSQTESRLIALLAEGAQSAEIAKSRETIRRLTGDLSASEARLQAAFPAFSNYVKPKPLPLDEARAALAPDEVLLFAFVSYEAVYVWCITREAVKWRKISISLEELEGSVKRLKDGLVFGPADEGAEKDSRPLYDLGLANSLYKRLFGDVDDVVVEKPHILYVPTGPLSTLPLHVLVRSRPSVKLPTRSQAIAYKEADWLIRKNDISVLPDVATLRVLAKNAGAARELKPILAFADPVYGVPRSGERHGDEKPSRGSARGARGNLPGAPATASGFEALKYFNELPGTREEVEAVAHALGASGDDLYLGNRASEAAIKYLDKERQLANYKVVYFAMHGIVADAAISNLKIGNREPALVMTLPEAPTAEDDGLLSSSDIAQLRLDADWVVLSACDTAAGDSADAEALSGLARAFFYAGARSILVTQWGASDYDARMLMTGVFQKIAREPALDQSQALRRAMLDRIDQAGSGIATWDAYPSYWGPFTLILAAR